MLVSVCRFRFAFRGTGESLLEAIRSRVSAAGGELTGSSSEGAFFLGSPAGDFRGRYEISGQTILLEVTEKPFFVPCGMIEARLAAFVKDTR